MPSPKKPSPAFPLYAGDVLADSGALSAQEMGILYRLTLNCWRLRVLPADLGRLSRLAQVPLHDLQAALPALTDHVYLDGDCYRCTTVEKAVIEQAAFAEKQRGRAMGRWKDHKHKTKRMPRHAVASRGVPEDAAPCPSASASDAATDAATAPSEKPPSAALGDVAAVVNHFKAEYERTQGTHYVGNSGRDRGAARRLLADFPVPEINGRATRFLQAEDDFLNRTDRSLSLFAQQFNRPCCRGIEPLNGNGHKPARSTTAMQEYLAAKESSNGNGAHP